jgi:hypothetical protein
MMPSAALRALANDRRLQILDWLKNPTKHFPAQVAGDLVDDGVCGRLIARKLRISQPTSAQENARQKKGGLPNSEGSWRHGTGGA